MKPALIAAAAALCVLPAPALAGLDLAKTAVARGDQGARRTVDLAEGWRFKQDDHQGAERPDYDDAAWDQVSVPHTWNRAGVYLSTDRRHLNTRDNLNTSQGVGWYRLTFTPPKGIGGKKAWLQFDAASRRAKVWLNGVYLGEHKGGFSRFRFDATGALKPGTANVLAVQTDSSKPTPGGSTADILPLGGDFFIHGGLYRSVSLIVTDPVHIDMMDMGGPGVYAAVTRLEGARASVATRIKVRNDADQPRKVSARIRLVDAEGTVVAQAVRTLSLEPRASREVAAPLEVARAHLWQGVEDPYLHRLEVELIDPSGRKLDRVDQDFGIRQIRIDPEKGLFLNGRPLRLRGVGMHQDQEGKGWAMSRADIAADMALIREMGANSIRLTHYQHGPTIHQLADRYGLLLWDEIPWVSLWTLAPDQVDATPGLAANARQQLQEMIRQNYNHPSVISWGLANEIDLRGPPPAFLGASKVQDRDPFPLLKDLNALAKAEDPTRPTALATCCEGLQKGAPEVAAVTDVSGANRYLGWYYGTSALLGPMLDALHAKRPDKPLAITEYGAGGATSQHTDDPLGGPIDAMGRAQPEEYQSLVHEQNWAVLQSKPYLWATWLWNSFDFATSARREGDADDINTKGLITYDRKVKKDAFYFYKANWSAEPTVHINGRRYVDRAYPVTDVRVYSNAPSTELIVNGASVGRADGCSEKICVWKSVRLAAGDNSIVARGRFGQAVTEDTVAWRLAPAAKDRFTIDSGAILAPTDAPLRHGSDAFFVGGVARAISGAAPAATGAAPWSITRTFREGDFTYQVPAAPGRYTVSLTFVEPTLGKGERVFDVLANGKVALGDLDIASQATGERFAVVRSFPVEVAKGGLTLAFKSKIGKAVVSAIDIAPRP